MQTHSIAGRFALRLLLFYGLLIVPWPGLKACYGILFRACSNSLFGGLGLEGYVEFRAPAQEHAAWDVEMHIKDPKKPQRWHVEFSSRGWGYLPTAAVIALTLTTPIPWPRRWRALGYVLLLVHLFIAARIAAAVVYGLYWGGAIALSDFSGRAAEVLLLSLSASPVTTFVVPVIIWLFVCFRRHDWQAVFGASRVVQGTGGPRTDDRSAKV